MSFVHLHCHTHYSFLQGLAKPADYLARAKELGMPAVAITDAGGVYGLLEFYEAATKLDIQPILGVQVFVAPFGRLQKRAGIDQKTWQLILLAATYTGYQNILKLVTASYLEGFYYRPRVDDELLQRHSEGIIALSGNFHGEVAAKLLSGDTEAATEAIRTYQGYFGADNFYLEILPHIGNEQQTLANKLLIDIAHATGTPLVAANACHYVAREDAEAQDTVLAIQKGVTMDTANRFTMLGTDFSFLSAEDMARHFHDTPEALENTLKIAEKCKVTLPLGARLIPSYATPWGLTPEEYLHQLCYEGLHRRYGIPIPAAFRRADGNEEASAPATTSTIDISPDHQHIIDRLEYEFSVIAGMGFANYFLIVWDFVKYARESGIMVGPGRGSAAGALISYVLNITNIDPLTYGLLFERFLNPERVSMPDIDIDFADDKREAVLEYVADKYGRDHVARICTFGTMAARAVVKDVGRTLAVPFADMNSFSALIPAKPGIKLTDALDNEISLKAQSTKEPYKKVIEIARKLEGNARQVGVHACAVVIADKPLTEYTALQYAPGSDTGEIITQYSMHPIEHIGLLKMDFLGLRNLTIIKHCLDIIQGSRGITLDIDAIPMDDTATLQLFAEGATTGVFQFESSGMKRYLKELQPSRFEDLIAMVALFRPGPMENIPQYIKGKKDPSSITYPHEVLRAHLEETYGVAVYQEQVQQIAQSFAGFSLGEGYLLIKAVAKKIPALLEEQRAQFIAGAANQGHTRKESEKLFDLIEPFAGYGFNKSHAASYAFIAYQTGYLKAHYPAEFMAALLTSDHGNLDRVAIDIEEARAMDIAVLPPSVDESLAQFAVTSTGAIRFGLSAIKGIGDGPIDVILHARQSGGPFISLADFAGRVDASVLNKRTLEALCYAGALDALGERAAIAESASDLSAFAKAATHQRSSTQASLFGDAAPLPAMQIKLKKVPPLTESQKLKWEKELLGMYVSAHPLAGLKKYLSKKIHLVDRLTDKEVGKQILVGGIVIVERVMQTKKTKESMAFLTLEDPTGSIEVSLFPKVYTQYRHLIEKGDMLTITGRLEKRGGNYNVTVSEVTRVQIDTMRKNATEQHLLDDSTGRPTVRRIVDDADDILPEAPVAPAEPYAITLPEGTTPTTLHQLKQLLHEHQDTHGTEVALLIPAGEKKLHRVRVPFHIGITLDLEAQIGELLAGANL